MKIIFFGLYNKFIEEEKKIILDENEYLNGNVVNDILTYINNIEESEANNKKNNLNNSNIDNIRNLGVVNNIITAEGKNNINEWDNFGKECDKNDLDDDYDLADSFSNEDNTSNDGDDDEYNCIFTQILDDSMKKNTPLLVRFLKKRILMIFRF